MSNQSSAYCYGSAAIKIEAPFLVLHEGGAGRTARRSERQHDAKPLGLGVLLAGALVCLAVIGGTYFAQAHSSQAVASALGQAQASERVVRDGESLWCIARECDVPGTSTRDVVDWIEAANSLDGGAVYAGQRILVPSGVVSAR